MITMKTRRNEIKKKILKKPLRIRMNVGKIWPTDGRVRRERTVLTNCARTRRRRRSSVSVRLARAAERKPDCVLLPPRAGPESASSPRPSVKV